MTSVLIKFKNLSPPPVVGALSILNGKTSFQVSSPHIPTNINPGIPFWPSKYLAADTVRSKDHSGNKIYKTG